MVKKIRIKRKIKIIKKPKIIGIKWLQLITKDQLKTEIKKNLESIFDDKYNVLKLENHIYNIDNCIQLDKNKKNISKILEKSWIIPIVSDEKYVYKTKFDNKKRNTLLLKNSKFITERIKEKEDESRKKKTSIKDSDFVNLLTPYKNKKLKDKINYDFVSDISRVALRYHDKKKYIKRINNVERLILKDEELYIVGFLLYYTKIDDYKLIINTIPSTVLKEINLDYNKPTKIVYFKNTNSILDVINSIYKESQHICKLIEKSNILNKQKFYESKNYQYIDNIIYKYPIDYYTNTIFKYNKFIEIYDEYPYFDKNKLDNNLIRAFWIKSHIDNGNVFYLLKYFSNILSVSNINELYTGLNKYDVFKKIFSKYTKITDDYIIRINYELFNNLIKGENNIQLYKKSLKILNKKKTIKNIFERKVDEDHYNIRIFLGNKRYEELLSLTKFNKKHIYELLTENEIDTLEKKIEQNKKKIIAFENNKCEHVNVLNDYLTIANNSNKYNCAKKLFEEFVDKFPEIQSTDKYIKCKLCGFQLICMHEKLETDLYFEQKKEEKEKIKDILENDYYISDELQTDAGASGVSKLCRFCGKVIIKDIIEKQIFMEFGNKIDTFEENKIKHNINTILTNIDRTDFDIESIYITMLNYVYDYYDKYTDLYISKMKKKNMKANKKELESLKKIITYSAISAEIIIRIMMSKRKFVNNSIKNCKVTDYLSNEQLATYMICIINNVLFKLFIQQVNNLKLKIKPTYVIKNILKDIQNRKKNNSLQEWKDLKDKEQIIYKKLLRMNYYSSLIITPFEIYIIYDKYYYKQFSEFKKQKAYDIVFNKKKIPKKYNDLLDIQKYMFKKKWNEYLNIMDISLLPPNNKPWKDFNFKLEKINTFLEQISKVLYKGVKSITHYQQKFKNVYIMKGGHEQADLGADVWKEYIHKLLEKDKLNNLIHYDIHGKKYNWNHVIYIGEKKNIIISSDIDKQRKKVIKNILELGYDVEEFKYLEPINKNIYKKHKYDIDRKITQSKVKKNVKRMSKTEKNKVFEEIKKQELLDTKINFFRLRCLDGTSHKIINNFCINCGEFTNEIYNPSKERIKQIEKYYEKKKEIPVYGKLFDRKRDDIYPKDLIQKFKLLEKPISSKKVKELAISIYKKNKNNVPSEQLNIAFRTKFITTIINKITILGNVNRMKTETKQNAKKKDLKYIKLYYLSLKTDNIKKYIKNLKTVYDIIQLNNNKYIIENSYDLRYLEEYIDKNKLFTKDTDDIITFKELDILDIIYENEKKKSKNIYKHILINLIDYINTNEHTVTFILKWIDNILEIQQNLDFTNTDIIKLEEIIERQKIKRQQQFMKYTPEEKMMFGITIGTDIETFDQQEILLQEQIELEDKKMDMIEQGQLGDDYSRKDNFDLIGNIDMDETVFEW